MTKLQATPYKNLSRFFTNVSILLLVAIVPGTPILVYSASSYKQNINKAWQVIDRQYVNTNFNSRDWLRTRGEFLSRNYTNKEAAYAAVRQMLLKLNDSETRLVDSKLLATIVREGEGQSTGVGLIDFSVDTDEKTNELRVVTAIADSPAAKAMMQPRDVIQAIDSVPTKQLNHDEAMMQLRGHSGTQVVLKVRRNNKVFDLSLTREAISLRPVQTEIKQERGKMIGYIALRQFTPNAAKEMSHTLKELSDKQVDGIVLDLRNNPGGLLSVCTEIASMFLSKERVVWISDRKGMQEIRASGSQVTNKPMVVLVNEGTASASEVLAAALQENRRAALVGTTTYGRGRVHTGEEISDGYVLLFAVGNLKTPNGQDIFQQGIKPNYIVTSKDSQYEQAITVLIQRITLNSKSTSIQDLK